MKGIGGSDDFELGPADDSGQFEDDVDRYGTQGEANEQANLVEARDSSSGQQ